MSAPGAVARPGEFRERGKSAFGGRVFTVAFVVTGPDGRNCDHGSSSRRKALRLLGFPHRAQNGASADFVYLFRSPPLGLIAFRQPVTPRSAPPRQSGQSTGPIQAVRESWRHVACRHSTRMRRRAIREWFAARLRVRRWALDGLAVRRPRRAYAVVWPMVIERCWRR